MASGTRGQARNAAAPAPANPGQGGGDGGGGGAPPPPGGAQGQPQPPAPVPFGLTPGLAYQGAIDFTTKAGAVFCAHATEKLDEDLCDCSPDGFYQFMQSCKTRAEACGWNGPNGVLQVPVDDTPNAPTLSMLEEHGQFDLARITEHEKERVNQRDRAAQDDRMLCECLNDSISLDGKKKLYLHRDEYVIEPVPALPGNQKIPSGLCFLKVLVRESHLDTNATTSMIRQKLSDLDSYINVVGNDISKFNGHVKMSLDTLASRGETTQDLLTNLFKGYGACSDKTFVDYIAKKQDECDEGKEMTAPRLMQLADTKCRTMKDKEIWEAPSESEEKILALEARLADLKKKFSHAKQGSGTKTGRNPKRKDRGDGKQGGKRKQQQEKPKWMFERPSDADLKKPRQWNGKDWWCCSHETGGKCNPGACRIHKPHQCEGGAHKKMRTTSGGGNGDNGADQNAQKITINQALQDLTLGGYESA